MKLSLKLQDDQNPLLKVKMPISIFSQPLISTLTTTAPTTGNNKSSQDTSFSLALATNFSSGPSLKLSCAPSTFPTTKTIPFSLSLRSGLGLFGSPKDSPLIFSAQFSLSSTNPGTVIPTFALHLKPQFGNFYFLKATSSNPTLELPQSGSHSISGTQFHFGSHSNSEFETPVASSGWQNVNLEPLNGGDDGLETSKLCRGKSFYNSNERSLVRKDEKKAGVLGGIAVRARTLFPATKRAVVNLRWALNFPSDLGSKMPYLTMNKIGIERVEEVEEVKQVKNKDIESNENDLELLKGMYMGMKEDLEMLEKENREMKQCLEDIRVGISAKNVRRESENLGRRVFTPCVENSNEFERRRSKKSVAEDKVEEK